MNKQIVEDLPKHIAIIMDGNRRWAKQRNLDPKLGHKEGAKVLETITRYANKIGIQYLTVYAFSTENWKRTKEEVGALMMLLQSYLDDFSKRADTENIKINILGDIDVLPSNMQKSIKNSMERTKENTGVNLNVAFNYGGRAEIVKAVKEIANKAKLGDISIDTIGEQTIQDHLYTKGQPDVDLLIRTSGEIRTSNFLPWQTVYSELVFLEKSWPEIQTEDFDECIQVFKMRNRKFGGK